jgi:hypothetical protein
MTKDARARHRRHRLAGTSVVLAAAIVAGLVIGHAGGSGGGSHRGGPGVGAGSTPLARPIATKGTFVSLLRLCRPGSAASYRLYGCAHGHYVEALEQFSLSDGRPVRAVTPVPYNGSTAVATPASTNDGTVLLTYIVGARCLDRGKPLKGPAPMECDSSPNSCINTVMDLSPRDPTPARLFTVSSAQTIGAAVPSPNGSEVAYTAQPCVGTRPLPGLYVRDLKTGVTRELADTSYCSSIGRPAWNVAGTEVVFRFRSVSARPQLGPIDSGPGCPANTTSGWNLAIAKTEASGGSSRRPAGRRPPRPVVRFPSQFGCSFDAAAFDSRGIVAAEGCTTRVSHCHSTV